MSAYPMKTSRAKARRIRAHEEKTAINVKELEEIISTIPKSLEQKLEEWKKRYLQYLKGEINYTFYDPYLALLKDKEHLSQYRLGVKFHLEKHNGNLNIHKIIRMIK